MENSRLLEALQTQQRETDTLRTAYGFTTEKCGEVQAAYDSLMQQLKEEVRSSTNATASIYHSNAKYFYMVVVSICE